MFNNSLWQSKSHARQPLYIFIGVMLVAFICIPFFLHFFGMGAAAAIAMVVALIMLVLVIVLGRKFRWNNNKLEFAITESGIYFTAANNNSYFNDSISNIAGYTFYPDGEFTTVIIKLKRPSNAGVFGNLKEIKMVRIENFDKLQDVFEALNVPLLLNENK